MDTHALVVLCTCPGAAAPAIAQRLVEDRLAACVNLLPAAQSVYRWQGAIETATETLLIAKTTVDRYPALEQTLKSLHPYEIPEILAIPVADGLPAYLDWVVRETGA